MNTAGLVKYASALSALAMCCSCSGAVPLSSNAPAAAVSHSSTSSSYQVLYRFKGHGDGQTPLGGLVNVSATLYGTTSGGGKKCHQFTTGCGTVFSVMPSGAHQVLYRFDPWQSGAYPQSGLINVHGTLYGTTNRGGYGDGTIYSVSTSGAETVVHSFQGGANGSRPVGPLLDVHGTFYGTTEGGGVRKHQYYHGTVYSLGGSGAYKTLYSFKLPPDAIYPTGGLINVNGTLYGETEFGGTINSNCQYGCGTVYRVTPSGVEKVLYRFNGGADGALPSGDLVKLNGTLYGTTYAGGNSCGSGGCGTVFSITPSGQEKVVYTFAGGSDGEHPRAGLINVNGRLYGTTSEGGSGSGCGYECGTIFSVTPAGVETVLYRFAGGTDGWSPLAPLLYVNGTLYGTTPSGGGTKGDCCGVVFAFTP